MDEVGRRDSVVFNLSLNTNTEDLRIGTRLNMSSSTFHGMIDDVRLFEEERSQAEICADAGISGTPACP